MHAARNTLVLLLAFIVACSGAAASAPPARLANGEYAQPAGEARAAMPDETGDGAAPFADAAVAVEDGTVPVAPLRFVIVPMHLVPAEGATGGDTRVDLELTADGTLRSHGAYVGQFVGDRVLARDGRELISIGPDGAVRLRGAATQIRFESDGSVAMPNGAHLTFGDDGRPVVVSPQGARTPGPARLEGYQPAARATATLIGLIVATTSLATGTPAAQ